MTANTLPSKSICPDSSLIYPGMFYLLTIASKIGLYLYPQLDLLGYLPLRNHLISTSLRSSLWTFYAMHSLAADCPHGSFQQFKRCFNTAFTVKRQFCLALSGDTMRILNDTVGSSTSSLTLVIRNSCIDPLLLSSRFVNPTRCAAAPAIYLYTEQTISSPFQFWLGASHFGITWFLLYSVQVLPCFSIVVERSTY